uniref:Uncharacterized protein n=1 Tax=Branchiostoma floridae TaxID=7739 RepID=C3ZGK7_BRAFL|eukprot:XP_002592222.1 hypothetical protein BRAFLDRAFT_70959 [Branchiostoma floridae]
MSGRQITPCFVAPPGEDRALLDARIPPAGSPGPPQTSQTDVVIPDKITRPGEATCSGSASTPRRNPGSHLEAWLWNETSGERAPWVSDSSSAVHILDHQPPRKDGSSCDAKVVTIDPACSLRSDLDTTRGRKLQLIIGPPEHIDPCRSSASNKTNCDPFCPGCVPTAWQINRDMDHDVASTGIKLSLLTFLAQR